MDSKAKLFGHPIHPMLIVFPLGLLATSVVFDVVAQFAASWLLRRPAPHEPAGLPLALSVVAVVLALVTGWLGGELVDRLGVGVDTGAHLNAPSSLSGRSAAENVAEGPAKGVVGPV